LNAAFEESQMSQQTDVYTAGIWLENIHKYSQMAALVGIPKQLIALPRPRATVRPHLAGDINKMLE
jgi:hypothetical protein